VKPVDRRRFLTGSLTTLGAGGLGVALGAGSADAGLGGAGSADAGSGAAAASGPQALADQVLARSLAARVPFDGPHQAGILTPAPDQATFLALDSIAPDRETLFQTLQAISAQARRLTQGDGVGVQEVDDPPPDSGILGPYDAPDSLTVTLALGRSLFDSRYGLAKLRPRHLTEMPTFTNDQIDPARSGGDVLVQVCAGHRDTVVHTVRELLRTVSGRMVVRWTIDGFQSAKRGPNERSSRRNLFAFRDGTGNPEVANTELVNRLVWVQRGLGEPAWTAGGSYVVARQIRMHVEFWDRVGMLEQEQMIGRERVGGAPLGGTYEYEDPRYDLDPKGDRIPLNAHIRLANPRTPETASQRILRRGYNYHRGVDEAGNLDQGLMFVAFQQDPERQFATIQRRLSGEPMVDYITPVGGGYFFAPPGSRGPSDWVGSGLVSA
jgi:deferrochelatase/peroxidase EfeB